VRRARARRSIVARRSRPPLRSRHAVAPHEAFELHRIGAVDDGDPVNEAAEVGFDE
jgi:hypothetical protein